VYRLKSILVLLAVVTLGAATVAFAQGGDDRDDKRGGWSDDGGGGGWDDDDDDDDDRWDDDDDDDDRGDWGRRGRSASATLRTAAGDRVGKVFFEQRRNGVVEVYGEARDLPPGFHGFHVHTTGQCVAPFTTAGGHYNPDATTHRDHAGDMPSLLANSDGDGVVAFETDRFTVSELRDADGAAVIVHAASDNFANIPTRYRSPASPPEGGPDPDTLATGDAGSRYACGVVR
jgi:superoxide dismutase, Cu-Zn family